MTHYSDLICVSPTLCNTGKLVSYDYRMKTQALNADKFLTGSVIGKLTLEGKIVNKETSQSLDSFYNSTKVIDNDPLQNHYINLCNISSSILSETSPLIENNLQTLIRESFITNSEKVPDNQINFENPSENAQHIQIPTRSNVNPTVMICCTFEITKVEAKFNALKSHVTCEISI